MNINLYLPSAVAVFNGVPSTYFTLSARKCLHYCSWVCHEGNQEKGERKHVLLAASVISGYNFTCFFTLESSPRRCSSHLVRTEHSVLHLGTCSRAGYDKQWQVAVWGCGYTVVACMHTVHVVAIIIIAIARAS